MVRAYELNCASTTHSVRPLTRVLNRPNNPAVLKSRVNIVRWLQGQRHFGLQCCGPVHETESTWRGADATCSRSPGQGQRMRAQTVNQGEQQQIDKASFTQQCYICHHTDHLPFLHQRPSAQSSTALQLTGTTAV